MYKLIAFLRRSMHLIYLFFYVVLLTNMVLGLFAQPVLGIKWTLYILGVMIISFILREVFSRGIFLFIVHLGISLLTFLIAENMYLKVILVLVIMSLAMEGVLYMRSNYTLKRFFEAPWPCFLVGMATIGLGTYFDNKPLVHIGYIFPIIIIMVFLVAMYLEGLESYIHKTKHVSGAPLKQIASVNSLIITAIMVITLTALILGNALHFDRALKDLLFALALTAKFVILIIINILKLILTLLGLSLPGNMTGSNVYYKDITDASLLSKIIHFILTALIILLVVFLLYKVFSWLIRLLLMRNMRDDDLVENLSNNKKHGFLVDKYVDPDKLVGNSPDIKARRIYKTRVQAFKRFFVPDRNATTKDILIMMNHSEGDNLPKEVDTLTDMYNDVRYGGVIPDSKFLKDMKKLK